MAIWKKVMMKIGVKNVAGLEVNSANRVVKIVDRTRMIMTNAVMAPGCWCRSCVVRRWMGICSNV